jgi:DNA-binding response OmpR family regulator
MNILLAEDDVHVSVIMQICLEKIGGHTVTVCEDGVLALTALSTQTFDLVILDGMMPKKDGLQVAREMKAEGRSEPIIFLSAKSDEKDVIRRQFAPALMRF